MVNIYVTVGAAVSKNAYAVPGGVNANNLTDGNFGTYISTGADTDPW